MTDDPSSSPPSPSPSPTPVDESAPELVSVTINGQQVQVPLGSTILEAAASLGIRIPTLCAHPDLRAEGSCRVCVVDVEGARALQASCTTRIDRPIVISTNTREVRQARQLVVELLLAEHCGQCESCVRNGDCELQNLAREVGASSMFARRATPRFDIDDSSPAIVRDPNKCVLCGRCVRTCADLQGVECINVANRGERAKVTTFGDGPLAESTCIACGQCITRCPTGALREKDATSGVWAAIDDPTKHVVIQTAPAPRAAIGECFGLEPGRALTYEMNTALRMCGFDRVFDTNFSADLTILEEGTELLSRLHRALVEEDDTVALPMFTSCSPGWVTFLEQFYPERVPHLSTAKSPQQMFGAIIKTYYAKVSGIDPRDIVAVSLMPCTAKKAESLRQEMVASGSRDVDHVLTTREMAAMFKQVGIHLPAVARSDFDDPFGTASGSGVIFGATGGVMESALRTVLELVTGEDIERFFEHADIHPVRGMPGVRTAEITIPAAGPVPALLKERLPSMGWLAGATLKVAIAHGTANARKVLDDIAAGGELASYHFIEFMACPGGCLSGGGQPIPTTAGIREARASAIYAEDSASSVRKSHQNPAVLRLYERFLTDGPGGATSHRLLHTSYSPREAFETAGQGAAR